MRAVKLCGTASIAGISLATSTLFVGSAAPGASRICHVQRLRTNQSQLGESARVPAFASYEELSPVPQSHQWIWRRGPHIRILSYLLIGAIVIILKLSDS